mmetsp:Transcript_100022/g.173584  ORF Transcript_100022/g.173584 Transcript_100022/m.173584 type:complete len:1371 (+) Transcript_100022:74-4186(+)
MSGPAPESSPEAAVYAAKRKANGLSQRASLRRASRSGATEKSSATSPPSARTRFAEADDVAVVSESRLSDGFQDHDFGSQDFRGGPDDSADDPSGAHRMKHRHSEVASAKTNNRYAWMRTLERPSSRHTIAVGKADLKSVGTVEGWRGPIAKKTAALRVQTFKSLVPHKSRPTQFQDSNDEQTFSHSHSHAHHHSPIGEVRRETHRQGNLFLGEDLMALPVFHQCRHKLLTEISRHMYTQSYAPGTEIVKEGTLGASMLLVLRGAVNMYVDGVKAQRLGDGQYFGETILLGVEEHWKATLKAETSCTIGEIRREDFLGSLDQYPVEKRFYELLRSKHKSVDCVWAGTLEQTVDLFKGLSERLVRQIDSSLVRRIYFVGEKILVEGKPGDEFYILVRGRASIEIAGRTVRIERRDSHTDLLSEDEKSETFQDRPEVRAPPGSEAQKAKLGPPICFGELGLLGMQQVRSATVVAQTVCQMRVLYRKMFLRSLEEHGESLSSMAHFFEQRYSEGQGQTPTSKLREVPIFREVGCKEDFLDFLGQHLEDRMYIQGQKIIDERMPDDRCMYIIGNGSVTVLKNDVEVARLSSGAVVGEITVLGLASKRSSTVVAAETCYVQVLHQSVVVRGLELFPEERKKVLMVAYRRTGGVDDDDDAPANSDFSGDGRRASIDDVRKDATESQQAPGADPSVLNDTGCMGTHRAFMKVLKASPLFANTNSAFVDEISNAAIDRIYMPGDLIIEQGMRGDSMFIMVSGQAGVFVSDPDTVLDTHDPARMPVGASGGGKAAFDKRCFSRVGTLHAGSISGELAMLGVSLIRSATIEAETICSMWEITQDKALTILERFPDAQRHFGELIVKHLERTVPARILSLQLFRGFDRKFRTLLGLYCERRVSFPGQCVAREGTTGDQLFCINLGKAMLEKKGVPIKTFSSGSHFGSTVMLGIHKLYVGSLVVVQTCHVLSINRTSYIQALDHYPSVQAANELKRSEQQATEDLREAIQRISARKLIWKRYQGMICPDLGKDGLSMANMAGVPTDSDMIQRCVQAWHVTAREMRRIRDKHDRERTQYKQTMEQWLKKRKDAMIRVQMKQQMDQIVIDAVNERWSSKQSKQDTLPPVSCQSPESTQLVSLLKAWPTPRQSKYYNLNVWNVLADSLESNSPTQTLLPLLTGPPNSAETNLSIGALNSADVTAPSAGVPAIVDITSGLSRTPSPETGGNDSDGEVSQVLEHSYSAEDVSNPGDGQEALRWALGAICPATPAVSSRLTKPAGAPHAAGARKSLTGSRLSSSSHNGRHGGTDGDQLAEMKTSNRSPRGSRQQESDQHVELRSNPRSPRGSQRGSLRMGMDSIQGPGRRLQLHHASPSRRGSAMPAA